MMPAKLSGNVYKTVIIPIMISSSSLGSRSVLAAVGRCPQHAVSKLACICCPLPDRVAPVLVQFVSPPLGCSPLSSFLFIWSPSGDMRGPSVVFQAVDISMTAQRRCKPSTPFSSGRLQYCF